MDEVVERRRWRLDGRWGRLTWLAAAASLAVVGGGAATALTASSVQSGTTASSDLAGGASTVAAGPAGSSDAATAGTASSGSSVAVPTAALSMVGRVIADLNGRNWSDLYSTLPASHRPSAASAFSSAMAKTAGMLPISEAAVGAAAVSTDPASGAPRVIQPVTETVSVPRGKAITVAGQIEVEQQAGGWVWVQAPPALPSHQLSPS